MPRPAPWTHVSLWLGLAALVVGVVLLLTTPTSTVGFASVAPRVDYAFVAGSLAWRSTVGPVLVLAGAVVASFAAGRPSAQRRH